MTPLPYFAACGAGAGKEEGAHYNVLEKTADAAQRSGRGAITMAEVQLSPELLSTLVGRSRRRLREVQASCQVVIKLDRMRGLLRLYGQDVAIEAAQRQLSSLGGPRKTVPAAVWAELFRTRTLQTSKQSIVLHLQELSGCRIHIERSKHEVRIFGPQEGIAVAERLLEELEKVCKEAVVPAEAFASMVSPLKLQDIGEELGVTLRLEESELVVLGLQDRVALALREISKYLQDTEGYAMKLSGEDAAVINSAWPVMNVEGFDPSELNMQGPQAGFGSSSSAGSDSVQMPSPLHRSAPPPPPNPSFAHGGRGQHQAPGAPRSARAPAPRNGSGAQGRGGPAPPECGACPTCGVGRFCHYCGHEIWVFLVNGCPPGGPRPDMVGDNAYGASRLPQRPTQHTYLGPMGEAADAGNSWMAVASGPARMDAAGGEMAPGQMTPGGSGAAQRMVGAPANGVVLGGVVPMCFPMNLSPDQASAAVPWVGNMPVTMAQGYPDGTNGNQLVRHVYMVPAYGPPSEDHSPIQF